MVPSPVAVDGLPIPATPTLATSPTLHGLDVGLGGPVRHSGGLVAVRRRDVDGRATVGILLAGRPWAMAKAVLVVTVHAAALATRRLAGLAVTTHGVLVVDVGLGATVARLTVVRPDEGLTTLGAVLGRAEADHQVASLLAVPLGLLLGPFGPGRPVETTIRLAVGVEGLDVGGADEGGVGHVGLAGHPAPTAHRVATLPRPLLAVPVDEAVAFRNEARHSSQRRRGKILNIFARRPNGAVPRKKNTSA